MAIFTRTETPEENKERPFPKIMKFLRGDNNVLILFHESGKGIVISSDKNKNSGHQVGRYEEGIDMGLFVEWQGKVIINQAY